jgi:hypothetical protein
MSGRNGIGVFENGCDQPRIQRQHESQAINSSSSSFRLFTCDGTLIPSDAAL